MNTIRKNKCKCKIFYEKIFLLCFLLYDFIKKTNKQTKKETNKEGLQEKALLKLVVFFSDKGACAKIAKAK